MNSLLRWSTLLVPLAACGGTGHGNDLVAVSPLPLVVMELLARDDDPLVVVDYDTMGASIWEEEAGVWRGLGAPGGGPLWTIGLDGAYLTLQSGALARSVDGEDWETLGPGVGNLARGNGFLLRGATSDGSYWAVVDIFSDTWPLHRLSPGATEWAPAFAEEVSWARMGGMGSDGTGWVVGQSSGDGSLQGLYRLAPDGSSLDPVFDCEDEELAFCEATFYAMTFNEDGDLFYYLRNDISGPQSFFRVDAGTSVATPLGGLPDEVMYASSIAASGDTLFITGRDSYEGGNAFLIALPGGEGARVITEAQGPNAEVVASSDGQRVYTHTPGVSELR